MTGQVRLGWIFESARSDPRPLDPDMTVSGASAAGSHAMSQQVPSITQHKRVRHPSVSEVQMQGANGGAMSGPASSSGKAGHRVDITA